jgi:hypothetical protein
VNWFEENPMKARLLMVFMILGFLELTARALVYVELLPYQPYPTTRSPEFRDNIDADVGLWRYPNAKSTLYESCLTAEFESNSFGAMDVERTFRSDATNRAIVLGDSFAAGHYVALDERFSALLEARTDTEHLNMAVGGTGTLFEWQVYVHKALQYDHSAVMVFIFPYNDFIDNKAMTSYDGTDRPVLADLGDGRLVHPWGGAPAKERSTGEIIKNTIDNNLYIANVLRWSARVYKGWKRGPQIASRKIDAPTYYDSFTEDDWRYFEFSIDAIAKDAGERPVYLFTIPYFKDFDYARENGYQFELVDRLNAFAGEHDNVSYYDMLPGFLEHAGQNGHEYMDYVWSCDLHWNPYGHEVATDIVYEALNGELYP